MSFFSNIKNALENRRLTRLRSDLMKIQKSEFGYDPFKVYMPTALAEKDLESKELLERLVWYSAKGTAIRQFYTGTNFGVKNNGDDTNKANYFWTTAPNDMRQIHSGLPNLISRKMATILFGPGYKIQALQYKADGESKDDKATKHATELLNEILEEMSFAEKLNLGAQAESWGGHVAFKLSYDFSISAFPIIEVVDRRGFDIVKRRGKTVAIIFNNFYEKKEGNKTVTYRFEETYSTNEYGYATIESKLFRKENISKGETEVPLESIPETFGLEPLFTAKHVKGLLAFEKPNLLTVNAFSNYPFGISDYEGAIDSFDGLDEIVTAIVNEIRDNKTIRHYDEDLLSVDDKGNFQKINKYVTNFLKVRKGNAEGAKPVETTEFKDKTDDHEKKYKILVAECCNMCGLSPLSLGITGLESINSSDKSTRERAKTTLETRKAKLELWIPFLKKLVFKTLEFASELQSYDGYSVEPGIKQIDVDYSNTDITVVFNDYIENSTEERIVTWGSAKQQRVASTEMAVKKIHGNDLTEMEIKNEVNAIKYEEGLGFDNPNNLLNPEDLDKKDNDNNGDEDKGNS